MGGLRGILTRSVAWYVFPRTSARAGQKIQAQQHTVKEASCIQRVMDRRALVVDDDASVRSLMSVLLTCEGYNVFQAGDGLEAFHELQKRHFDVVISDYHMPRYDGMQLLATCRSLWPETAVVLVSGEDSDWTKLAVRGGAHAWVKKPYERSELVASVRQAVEKVSVRTTPHADCA